MIYPGGKPCFLWDFKDEEVVLQEKIGLQKNVLRQLYVFALFGDMILDVFSEYFTNVQWICLGIWTENVARVLIKISDEVDYYFDIRIN